MSVKAKIRLYVEHPLGQGQSVPLSRDQANYLFNVMRLQPGAMVALFNGADGEWQAEVVEAGKRGGVLVARDQSAPQRMPPDLWLLFAPIKKARTDFIVEKAAEMGAARILPVQSEFTNAERVRQDRLQAHAVEAAEQCGGVFVPPVEGLQKLDRVLADWPETRALVFCDGGCLAACRVTRPCGGGWSRWCGDPDRTRGRVFGCGTRAAGVDAAGGSGGARPPRPARRYRRRRRPDRRATGLGRLGMIYRGID